MSLWPAVVRQFRRPSGLLGHVAGWIMATRASNQARNRWTLDLLGVEAGERVLEIGCGPGYALALAAERVGEDGWVLGLDHSAVMVAQARRRNRGAIASGRAVIVQGSVEALESTPAVAEGGFDAVYSANVIQFLPDQRAAFASLWRALRPGGRIATCYLPRGPEAGRAGALAMAERVTAELTVVGFQDIRTELLDLAPVPAVCILGYRSAQVPASAVSSAS